MIRTAPPATTDDRCLKRLEDTVDKINATLETYTAAFGRGEAILEKTQESVEVVRHSLRIVIRALGDEEAVDEIFDFLYAYRGQGREIYAYREIFRCRRECVNKDRFYASDRTEVNGGESIHEDARIGTPQPFPLGTPKPKWTI
jgi:exonuclease VII small subunit